MYIVFVNVGVTARSFPLNHIWGMASFYYYFMKGLCSIIWAMCPIMKMDVTILLYIFKCTTFFLSFFSKIPSKIIFYLYIYFIYVCVYSILLLLFFFFFWVVVYYHYLLLIAIIVTIGFLFIYGFLFLFPLF